MVKPDAKINSEHILKWINIFHWTSFPESLLIASSLHLSQLIQAY